MPQHINDRFATDNGMTNANDCYLIHFDGADIGSGKVHSYVFPKYSSVYSFQCYSGDAIGSSWCLSEEANFGVAMAYAAAIRWDAECN